MADITQMPGEGRGAIWRDKAPTQKQMQMIRTIEDFAMYPIPHFAGTTRGEASDWIARYADISNTSDWAIEHGY